MTYPPLRLECSDGVATLTLCRPEDKNLITHEWVAAFQEHCHALERDRDTRCVLLKAEGPLFSAGADVKAMAAHMDSMEAHLDSLILPVHAAIMRLTGLPAPVVCLLQGTAAGGGLSLALACDIVVAARSARMVIAYPRLGTTPDAGLSHALIERLGAQRALEVFLLEDTLDMAKAHDLGLVNRVFDDADAAEQAHAVARRLAALPSSAAKKLFLNGRQALRHERLDRERDSFLQCSRTAQFRASVQAFGGPRD